MKKKSAGALPQNPTQAAIYYWLLANKTGTLEELHAQPWAALITDLSVEVHEMVEIGLVVVGFDSIAAAKVSLKKNVDLDAFKMFVKAFPGTKSSVPLAFDIFCRHKDAETAVHLLLPALEAEMQYKQWQNASRPGGAPAWANLNTWVGKQRRWEWDYKIPGSGTWDPRYDEYLKRKADKAPQAQALTQDELLDYVDRKGIFAGLLRKMPEDRIPFWFWHCHSERPRNPGQAMRDFLTKQ